MPRHLFECLFYTASVSVTNVTRGNGINPKDFSVSRKPCCMSESFCEKQGFPHLHRLTCFSPHFAKDSLS